MPVTRIKENQITDLAVTNAKIANATIAGGKLSNNLTYGSNLVVSGNLTVSGTTTTVDTTTTTVSDPILLLASDQTGSGAKDIGIIGERGDDTNVFIGWDESADKFIVATTSDADANTTITVTDHADMQVGGLTVDDALGVSGESTLASATVSDLTENQVLVPGASGALESTDKLTFDETTLAVTGAITASTTATITGNITGGNLTTAGTITDGTATIASGAIAGATTGAFSGTVTAGAFNDGAATYDAGTITNGVAATFSGLITGGSLNDGTATYDAGTITNAVAGTFSGQISAGSLTTAGSLNVDGATTIGQITIDASSTFDAGANKLTNIGAPTADQDAASKKYVDDLLSSGFTLSDGSTTQPIANGDTLTVAGTNNEVNVAVSATDTLTIGLPDDVTIGNDLTVTGSLTVNGTTTTVSTTTSTLQDPIFQLGRGAANAALESDDNKDRGLDMFYYDGSEKQAFMGWDNSASSFIFISDATNTSEVISGTSGKITVGEIAVDNIKLDGNRIESTNTGGALELVAEGAGKVTLPTGNELVVTDLANTGVVFSNSGELTADATNLYYDGTEFSAKNINSDGYVTATGNVTGGNLVTAGSITDGALVSSDGTITGGVAATFSGLVTAGSLNDGTATYDAGVISSGVSATFSGLVTAGSFNDGAATYDAGTITNGVAATFSGLVTAGSFNDGAATYDAGTITNGVAATFSGAVQGATVTGTTSVAGGNLTISGNTITGSDGKVIINDASGDIDFIVESNGNAGMLVVDGGSDSVSVGTATQTADCTFKISATDSMMIPAGTTAQRPSTGVAGMLRYNSTTDSVEYYDVTETAFKGLNADFTVIAGQQFDGDNSTVAFTLSSSQTTASCIVSINGVLQLPTTAYGVSGTTLTFTEAPASGDKIEVRQLTTSSTITQLANGDSSITITAGSSNVDVKGNIVPTVDETNAIGSSSNGYKDLFIAAITKIGTNGSGDIGQTGNRFNVIYGTSTSAQYADLAEKYEADADYDEGTVVMFGGDKEVTICDSEGCTAVAGIISTNPAFSMNDDLEADHVATVALVGRVPCKVTGSIKKGDIIISAGDGKGKASDDPKIGAVIGKALADSEGEGVIEVVVKH